MKPHPAFRALVFALCLLGANRAAAQQTTAFTYQGQLRDGGTNANGTYALTFKLYNAAGGGSQVGSTLAVPSQLLVNGLFTVNLDFGTGAFDGTGRWLEINVAGDTLSPRVQVLPAPYALYSSVAANLLNPPWTTSVGTYNGRPNVLKFSTDQGLRMVFTPDGIASQIFGKLNVDDLDVNSGDVDVLQGDVYARAFNVTSDRNAKENFAPIDGRAVLKRVMELPISSWNFKTDEGTRHIGPMAQDFLTAFNVGADDRRIATVDADGVALAAIQGLHEIVQEKDEEIAALKQRLTNLEKAVSALAKQKGSTP